MTSILQVMLEQELGYSSDSSFDVIMEEEVTSDDDSLSVDLNLTPPQNIERRALYKKFLGWELENKHVSPYYYCFTPDYIKANHLTIPQQKPKALHTRRLKNNKI